MKKEMLISFLNEIKSGTSNKRDREICNVLLKIANSNMLCRNDNCIYWKEGDQCTTKAIIGKFQVCLTFTSNKDNGS